MGFTRKYFKDYNFMLCKAFGDIDNDSLMQHVIDLNKETEGMSNLKELDDYREITSVKLLSTQMTTISAAHEKDKPDSKLAILATKDNPEVYEILDAYRMFSAEHRESVKLFENLQDAISWLSDSDLEAKYLLALVKNN